MSTTPIIRKRPAALADAYATPFKLFIPRELTQDDARLVWDRLRESDDIVLADPFALEGVSTVFPGVLYGDVFDMDELTLVADILGGLELDVLEDSWLEHWVPEAYEDQAEALAVDDLTDPRNNI